MIRMRTKRGETGSVRANLLKGPVRAHHLKILKQQAAKMLQRAPATPAGERASYESHGQLMVDHLPLQGPAARHRIESFPRVNSNVPFDHFGRKIFDDI